MGIPDEAFREAFKPIQIPAHYDADYSDHDKIIFALASIGKGALEDVIDELIRLDSSIDAHKYYDIAKSILSKLFKKGLINGSENNGVMCYNLSKITHANDGAVDPGLLAPGLD